MFRAFGVLRHPRFARLYAAQTVSQVGDALTWVALALLAYELAGPDAAVVLAVALTLRVGAYVLLSPWAGVLADRTERRTLLAATHLGRAAVIAWMPLVTEVWQVYVLMFLLNAFTAFFTPTNQATVPLLVGRADAGRAFALSSATTELLAIVGPGVAGVLAAWVGGRALFSFDAATFVLAGVLVLTLPNLRASAARAAPGDRWRGVRDGTARLWRDPAVRFALSMELVAAIVGALVLTVTVVRVKGGLGLGDAEYGWVMALYGLGAVVASLAFGAFGRRVPRTLVILIGAVVTSAALVPADAAPLAPLMALWMLAGMGQNWVNLPTETLLAERTDEHAQGRVFGAHFAWSHVWWAFTYPLASLLSVRFPGQAFRIGGLIAVTVLIVAVLVSRRGGRRGPPGPGASVARCGMMVSGLRGPAGGVFLMLKCVLLTFTLALVAAPGFGEPDPYTISVGYEGTYGILVTPTGSLLDAIGVRGVVAVVDMGDALCAHLPDHLPIRFVPAGRHRFVSPDDGARLTFEIADGRVRQAFLDGHAGMALVPVNGVQAALARLARAVSLSVQPGDPGANEGPRLTRE